MDYILKKKSVHELHLDPEQEATAGERTISITEYFVLTSQTKVAIHCHGHYLGGV